MPVALAPAAVVRPPLDRLRGLIRRYVVLDGLLAAGGVAVAASAVSLAADLVLFHAANVDVVLDAPWAVRAFLLGLVGLAVAGVVGVLVAYRVTRQFSDLSLALLLEKRFPEVLGDRLVTAVELADEAKAGRAGYSLPLVRKTVAEADERLARVPVATVFDWRRLRVRAGRLALLAAVLLAGLVAYSARRSNASDPGRVAYRAIDTAALWAERNVLLRDTPWPRSSHVEVLEPTSAELRIARDASAPKVRVRAYQWVIAERGTLLGWRPLAWADLPGLGIEIPDALGVAADGPVDAAASSALAERADVTEAFDRLGALAEQGRMGRTLRRLDAPPAVTLRYAGFTGTGRAAGSTRGEVPLTRDPNGDYTAELAGLKESVAYTVRARDFRTATRQIVLVPPPQLTRLVRVEAQPAYLFHPPPVDAPPGSLAGLRQLMPEKDLSLTGERSVCTVPAGTELDLTGAADKPLAAVTVTPKAGRVPTAVTVAGDTFTLRFAGAELLIQDAAFDLTLTDADGVSSVRPVLIQVAEDQPPQVEIAVEGLRKTGNGFLATPKARVPFVKESVVRDDTGLRQVEFQFTAVKLESAAVAGLQAQAAVSAFTAAGVSAGLTAATGPIAAAALVRQLSAADAVQAATLPVPAFAGAFGGLPRSTAAGLAARLAAPWTGSPGVIKEVRFGLDGDGFDLQDADAVLESQGRRMRAASPGDVQPRYKVEVSLVATDGNAVAGPKQGRNLEPIRLTVLSEADLLAEISADEAKTAGRFDEALVRLREAQRKLSQQADQLSGATLVPDLMLAARVRAEDIVQDVAKGRDLIQSVVADYLRLRAEVVTNRCDPLVPERYDTVVLRPLEAVFAAEYKAADEALAGFRDPLLDGRRPESPATAAARTTLAALITRLEQIRRDLGDALTEKMARDTLLKIIASQRQVSAALDALRRENRTRLFAPDLLPTAPVTVKPGGTVAVTQKIDWKLFDKGELRVRFDAPPGNEVTVPAEMVVKDDQDGFEYKLTAGAKAGEYVVRVVPSVGPPVEVRVTVK